MGTRASRGWEVRRATSGLDIAPSSTVLTAKVLPTGQRIGSSGQLRHDRLLGSQANPWQSLAGRRRAEARSVRLRRHSALSLARFAFRSGLALRARDRLAVGGSSA